MRHTLIGVQLLILNHNRRVELNYAEELLEDHGLHLEPAHVLVIDHYRHRFT